MGGGVIADLMVRFGADIGPMQRQMREVNRMMDETGQQSRTLGQRIQQNRTQLRQVGQAAVVAGTALMGMFVSAARAGASFEADMNRVRAVSGATGQEFDALSGQARELGASTRFSAAEAAQGMTFLSMAGFEATETLDAMPGVLQLAAAGAIDLATAADIASNVLQGYGMQADEIGRVNDVMAATFTSANTNLQDLGHAMSFVAPVAQSAGVEFEETAAAIGLMGDAGIQGSRAGTSLRMAISSLLSPTGAAADVVARLGIEATTAEGGLVPLEDIIRQLEESGATTADMMELFGQRAGPGMAVLVERGADALADFTQDLRDSGGTAEEIANIQMQGLQGSLIELRSAWEGLRIALFESGIGDWAETLVDAVTGVVRRLESAPQPVQTATAAVAGLGGAALITGGSLLILLPRIVDTIDAARRMNLTLASLRGFLLGPWGAALAIGAGALMIYANEKRKTAEAADNLREALGGETEAVEENTAAWVQKELRERGLLDVTRDLGISSQVLTDAIMGQPEALEAVHRRLDELNPEMEGYVRGSERGGDAAAFARTEIERLAGVFADVIPEVREAELATSGLEGVLDGLNPTLRESVLNASSLDEAIEQLPRHLKPAADATNELTDEQHDLLVAAGLTEDQIAALGPEFEDAAASTDELTEAQKRLQTVIQQFVSPMSVYQSLLQEKTDKEHENARKLAEQTDDQSKSWEDFVGDVRVSLGEYADALEEQIRNQQEWEANLVVIAGRAGADVAQILAEMGEEGVDLVAEMANGTQDEVDRVAELLRDGAERGGDGYVTELAGAMERAETVMGVGGTRVVAALVRELNLGGQKVTEIVNQYGQMLADGLNPVLRSVDGQVIVYSASSWRNVQAAQGITGPLLPHNTGGLVPGRGANVDTVPAILTRGEFVFSRDAVDNMGPEQVARLHELARSGRLDPHALHLNTGGFASLDDVPKVPSVPSGDLGRTAGDAMEHTRERVLEWLEENLLTLFAANLPTGPGDSGLWRRLWQTVSSQFPGINLHSAFRPGAITATGNRSYHGMGRAIDISPRMDVANWIRSNFMPQTRELIFSPMGGRQVHNGRNHFYSGITRSMHWDHIHWAMNRGGLVGSDGAAMPVNVFDRGGFLPTGESIAVNNTGQPEMVLPGTSMPWRDAQWTQDLIDAIEALEAEIREAQEAEERRRRDERLEGLEGEEREAFLREEEREAERRAQEERIEMLREAVRIEQEIARNREQFEFDQMTLGQQLRWVEERMAAERQFTDEWVRLARQRDQIAEEMHRKERERVAELQRAHEEAHARLVQMLDQRDRIEERMAARQTQFHQDVQDARQRFAAQADRLIAQRQEQLLSRLDPTQRLQRQWAASAASLVRNLDQQTDMIRRWAEGLQELRDRGLSQAAIDALGLESDVSMVFAVERLLRETDADLSELDRAVADRAATMTGVVKDEAENTASALGQALLELNQELYDQLGELHAQFLEDMEAMQDELAEVGLESGRTFAEAIAEGIESGIPAIEEAARKAREAMRKATSGVGAGVMDPQRQEARSEFERLVAGGMDRQQAASIAAGLMSFHSGGVVPGAPHQERIVRVRGQEVIKTPESEQALVRAIERLASQGLKAGDELVLVVDGRPMRAVIDSRIGSIERQSAHMAETR